MLLLIAFALFALLIAAWIAAPGATPERRDADVTTRTAMPGPGVAHQGA